MYPQGARQSLCLSLYFVSPAIPVCAVDDCRTGSHSLPGLVGREASCCSVLFWETYWEVLANMPETPCFSLPTCVCVCVCVCISGCVWVVVFPYDHVTDSGDWCAAWLAWLITLQVDVTTRRTPAYTYIQTHDNSSTGQCTCDADVGHAYSALQKQTLTYRVPSCV